MWVAYRNGNYEVLLNLNDGTKIRYNKEDSLIPDRPESMDVKITNQCNYGCLFCHENSTYNGKQASLESLYSFAKNVLPYTEIACGGGSLMEDPKHTEFFLRELKNVKAIPSITIQQQDFINHQEWIKKWVKEHLVYGIGVSVDNPREEKLHEYLKLYPNAVIHTIAGLYDEFYYQELVDKGYKMLVLGFKRFRRGSKYYNAMNKEINKNLEWLSNNILDLSKRFNILSFDNLALEQLDMKNKVPFEIWSKYYCGDDGNYTFYVDLVEGTFAKNSTSIERFPIGTLTPLGMFSEIRSLND